MLLANAEVITAIRPSNSEVCRASTTLPMVVSLIRATTSIANYCMYVDDKWVRKPVVLVVAEKSGLAATMDLRRVKIRLP